MEIIYPFKDKLSKVYNMVDNDFALINLKSKGAIKERFDNYFGNMFNGKEPKIESEIRNMYILSQEDIDRVCEVFADEYTKLDIPVQRYHTEISESVNVSDYENKIPLFFIFNGGNNLLANLIKFFSKGDYSHASMSTEGVSEVTSFANTYRNNGFVTETFAEFLDWRKPSVISIVAVPVDFDAYKRVRSVIRKFRETLYDYKFSTKKLILFGFHKKLRFNAATKPKDMICVEYVNYILNMANVNLNMKYWITPSDMNKTLKGMGGNSDLIFEGPTENFRVRLIDEYKERYSDKVWKKKEELDALVDEGLNDKLGLKTMYNNVKNLVT